MASPKKKKPNTASLTPTTERAVIQEIKLGCPIKKVNVRVAFEAMSMHVGLHGCMTCGFTPHVYALFDCPACGQVHGATFWQQEVQPVDMPQPVPLADVIAGMEEAAKEALKKTIMGKKGKMLLVAGPPLVLGPSNAPAHEHKGDVLPNLTAENFIKGVRQKQERRVDEPQADNNQEGGCGHG
jgi:hypothetical protein